MPNIQEVLAQNLTRPNQYDAALDDTVEILALACAGSGKSRTLAYRIARLIAQGIDPKGIVAFTFTEKAAESIKLRVASALKAVGVPDTVIGAMYIGTIHSYCQNLLGAMDARYRQFDVLDENRLKLYLISRYPQLGLHHLRERNSQQVRYFEVIRQVSDAWKVLNDEMLDLTSVAQYDAALGDVRQCLRTRLNQDQYIDFSMMIRLVVEALQIGTPQAKQAVGALQHLIVDEYQDVNPAQEILISQLHSLGATLFVVGDDDQAIYSWRGADVSNILDFQQRFPNAARHNLPKNFRSTPSIVAAADAFIAAELGARRLTKNPQADPPNGPEDFRKLWFQTRVDEANWVADRIVGLLGTQYREKDGTVRGLTPADFAILMRSTRQPEGDGAPRHLAFTQALNSRNIDYSLEAGGGIFDRAQVSVLRDTFGLLRNENPARETLENFFHTTIEPIYPHAEFSKFANVMSDWGRRIHPPAGVRQRLFPQQLVHDLLESLGIQVSNFDSGTMQDLGVFSRMLQDVETVYLSIDSPRRFGEILNFLEHVAETGYDTSTHDVLLRPDAVTVSTVHKVKGLEFPVVFVVDVESQRFPKNRSAYDGWLPQAVIAPSLDRGAYQSTAQEEARLFYTAITRAERLLYVTGSANLPGAKRVKSRSSYFLRLAHPQLLEIPNGLPAGLQQQAPRRRIDETVMPTSFSEVRYFLRCPKDFQFRKSFGFSPAISEMFGFGKTVHTAVEKLHELFPATVPTPEQAGQIAEQTFHLKHVAQSQDPINRPGGYERAKAKAVSILKEYTTQFSADFIQERAVEVRFEIPLTHAVLMGAIDLLLKVDENNQIMDATVIDFKAIEGGPDPANNPDLDWTMLALQVQLYAHAAREVLTQAAKTGTVHLLKDNQRLEVPITDQAIAAAIANVEWAVDRILLGDFPMRPHPQKCAECDFKSLCAKTPQDFQTTALPPEINVPGGIKFPPAISEFDEAMNAGGVQGA
jgi:DNA helicase II / ATP-dependent DNA helicase PcrA